jgi:2,4-dienoyl-CoA reductase-like NADH-dependent reductase (Old Yellow Enzyme family)
MTAPTGTDSLARPLTLPCGVTLPNRLAKSPMSEGLGDRHNAPTDRLARLYRRWSTSGAGLLVTGNVMVDSTALGEPGNVVVSDDRDVEALRSWAAAATSGGAQAWVQINHPGRQVVRGLNAQAVAPSAVGAVAGTGGLFATPRALTAPEIPGLIGRFARTARIVVDAGFTGVQIHAAHGYLISQFLSPLVNQRTDDWGGTPEKRRRFLLEIVRAVRSEIGPGVPLGVKLNSADFQRGGMTEDESAEVVLALAGEGIDLLEISGGTYESAAMMGVPAGPRKASTRAREAYFLDYAERVRALTSTASTTGTTGTGSAGPGAALPLMLSGGFRTAAAMSEAITSGAVDLIGLGRPLALEPDLPQRLLDGAATASTVRPRRTGIARIDGASETAWYTVQLWRMADGKDPDPGSHPVLNLARYSAAAGLQSLRRKRRAA